MKKLHFLLTLLLTGSFYLSQAQSPGAYLQTTTPTICKGEPAKLRLFLYDLPNQSPPFEITYSINGVSTTISGITAAQLTTTIYNSKTYFTYDFNVTLNTSTSITLTQVKDGLGAAVAIVSNQVWITIQNTTPTFYLSNGANPSCSGSATTYQAGYIPCQVFSWEYSEDGITYLTHSTSVYTAVFNFINTGLTAKNFYIRIKVGTNGNEIYSTPLIQNVLPTLQPGSVQASTLHICNGQTLTLTSTGHSGSVKWEVEDGFGWRALGNGNPYSSINYGNGAIQKYRAVYNYSSPSCTPIYSSEISVTTYGISPPSVIYPLTKTVCNNEPFTIISYGGGTNLQWQQSEDASIYTDIPNATSRTLDHTLINSGTTNKIVYLRIRNFSLGCGTSYSDVVTCTVTPSPAAGTSTAFPEDICSGQKANLQLNSSVGNIQWYYSSDNINFNLLYFSTGASTFSNTLGTNNTVEKIYFRATSSISGCATTPVSTVSSVNVYKSLSKAYFYPLAKTVCTNEAFSIIPTYSTGNQQWEQSEDGFLYSEIPNATSATLNHSLLNTGSVNKTVYLRLRSYSLGCGSAYSDPLVCTVRPAPAISIASISPSNVCSGQSSSLSLTSASGDVQWYSSVDNLTFQILYPGTGLSTQLNSLYTNTNEELRYYRAVSKFTECASTAVSNTVILTLNKIIWPAGYPSEMYNLKVCNGNSALVKALPVSGANFQWYEKIGNDYIEIPGATTIDYQTPVLINTTSAVITKTFSYSIINGACARSAGQLNIPVYPTPVAGTLTTTKNELCKDQFATLNLSGNTSSNTSWLYSTNGGTTFTVFNSYSTSLSSVYVNLVSQNYIDVLYKVSVTDNVCAPVISNTVNIRTYNVSPDYVFSLNEPYPKAISLCEKTNGELIRLKNTTPFFGTYIWQQSSNNVTFIDIVGSDNLPNYTLPAYTNTTGATQTFYYRAKLTNGAACIKYSDVYTVNISRQLQIGTLSATSATEFCQTGNLTVVLTGHNGSLKWYNNGGNSNLWGTGLTNTFTLYASGTKSTANVYAETSITDYAFPSFYCQLRSNVVQATIYSNPQGYSGTLTIANCRTIKHGEQATLNIGGTVIGDHYQWLVKSPGSTTFVPYKNTLLPTLTTDPLDYIATPNPTFYEFKAMVLNGVCTTSSQVGYTVLVKVIPQLPELIVPSTICSQTSFIVKIKNYGQSSVTLFKTGTTTNYPLTTATLPGYWSATIPITATTSYSLISNYGTTCSNFTDNFTITKDAPLSIPTIINGATNICPDNLSLNYSVPVQNTATYEWAIGQPAMGTFTSNGENIVFTPTPGLYGSTSILCRVSNSCNTTLYASKSIIINPAPAVQFVGLPSDVCLFSTPIQLNSNVIGAIFNGTNVTAGYFDPSSIGSFYPTITYTDPITTCAITKTQLIEVRPLPLVNAGPDLTVCQGTSIVLTGNGTGVTSYSWNQGVINNTAFIPSASSYTVTGSSAYGCTATDNVSVIINPLPIINNIADKSVCDNNSFSASLTSSNLPTATFDWASSTTTPSIGGYSNGSGSLITDLLTNSGSSGSVTYIVSATKNSCVGTKTFIVTVNPNPLITSTLSNATPCPNQTITYSYTRQSGFTYNQSFSSNLIPVTINNTIPTQTINTLLPDMQNSTINLLVTNSSTNCVSSETKQINVKPLPIITATDATVCAGTLADILILSNDPLATYDWILYNPPGSLLGLTASGTGNHILGTPEGSGTATYGIQSTGSNGCSTYNPTIVRLTVNPNPVHSVTVSSNSVCEGSFVSIHIGTPANPPGFFYGLTPPAGFIYQGSGGNPSGYGVGFNTGSASGSFIVTSSTNNGTGCGRVTTYPITVNPLPTVTAGPDKQVCQGTSIILSGAGTGAINYTWDKGVQDNVSFIPTSTIYTVTAHTASGCIASDAVAVIVNPKADLQIIGLPNIVCLNSGALTLSANIAGGAFSGQGMSGNQFTPSTSGLKTITYTYTDANLCTSTTSKNTNVQSKLFHPTLCNGQAGWCSPKAIDLCLNDAIPASIKWYDSNQNLIPGNYTNIIPYSYSDTLYYISYTSPYYCESDLMPIPVKIGAPKVNALQICTPRTVNLNTLVDPYMDPSNLLFYTTLKGGVPINQSSTYLYYVANTITLYVAATYFDSDETCSSGRVPFVITVGGCSAKLTEESFAENTKHSSVLSYPMPATTELTISGLTTNSKYKARFIDAGGHVILNSEFTTGSSLHEINIQTLQSGLYILVLTNDKEAHTLKIIKE